MSRRCYRLYGRLRILDLGRITIFIFMADRLYLSIWFPSFSTPEMLPRMLSVIKQFTFSRQRGGIGYLAVHSISWEEPIVFQQTFDYRADPERVLALASEF